MAVYDDEQQKTGVSDDELRRITGVSPDEEGAMEREAYNGAADDIAAPKSLSSTQLQESETAGAAFGGGKTEAAESAALGASAAGDFAFRKEAARKFIITKKQGVVGGIVGVLVGGSFGALSIMQGPLQLMHFSQLLQRFHLSRTQDLTDNSLSKLYKYMNSRDLSRQDRRIGKRMSQVAQRYDARLANAGLKFDYDSAGTFRGVEVLDPDGEGANKLKELGYEPVERDGRMYFEPTESSRYRNGARRNLIGASFHAADVNGVSGAVGSRIEIRRAGASFKILGNTRSRVNETELEFRQRVREAYDEKIRRGEYSAPRVSAEADPNDPPDEEGNRSPNEATGAGAGELNAAIDEAGDAVGGARYDALRESITNRLEGSNKALLAVALVCVANSIGDGFDSELYESVILPGMRIAQATVSIGDQARSPVESIFLLSEMGVHSENYYDEIDDTSWASAKSVQAELGQEQTGPDIPDYARPNQEQNTVLSFIGGLPALDGICNVAGNAVVGFGLSIVTAATGLGFVLDIGADIAASEFIIPPLVNFIANWFSLQGISSYVAGATFGNIANVYSRVLTNDQAIGIGGVDQGESGDVTWRRQRLEAERIELASMSLKERLFDVTDSRSLVAKAMMAQPVNDTDMLQSFARVPFTALASLSSIVKMPFSSELSAATPYDYGFNLYGFSEAEMAEDSPYANPYENEDRLEAIFVARQAEEQRCHAKNTECPQPYSSMEELNTGEELTDEHGGPKQAASGQDCFSAKINSDGSIIHGDAVRFYDLPEECHKTQDEAWTRYRFMHLYLSTETSAACFAGDESACAQLGFNSSGSTSNLPSGDAAALAKQLLESPNVSSDNRDQLESIAAGQGPCPTVNNGQYTVDTELLRILVALSQDNTYTISSLHRGCTSSTVGSGTASRHWRGKAVDISGSRPINGVTMPSFEAYDETGEIQRLINKAKVLLPSGCELGVPNNRYKTTAQQQSSPCNNVFLDTKATTGATAPHIHIGVP